MIIIIVTSPLHESRLLWIHDPHHNQPPRVPSRQPPASQKTNTVPRTNDTVPRSNNKVPRNNDNVPRNSPIPQYSDARVRAPLENIPSSMWHNSNLSSRSSDCPPVPRNNVTDRQQDQQKTVSPLPRKRGIAFTEEREERESGLREEKHLIMMRDGPLSAWELLPVPVFQTK